MNLKGKLKLAFLATLCLGSGVASAAPAAKAAGGERIANIINFVRGFEPRDTVNCSREILRTTVKNQIDIMRENSLTGTFLLQYDALIDGGFQQLMKQNSDVCADVGAWWEITQPHCEAAGIKWRGRYSWDWHAQFDFSIGYAPDERLKLVDVYMAKFKEIFGHYPTAVGSWYLDGTTLQYMHEKYAVVASCICRDQVGTDGYTLWGGYWHGGYYPSKQYLYMPAQTREGQIDVPVFRMLGSDPLHQYDAKLEGNGQGVVTLEPAYAAGGGSESYVDWYLKVMTKDPCLGYTYFQTGQENSFVWPVVARGFAVQMPRLAKYRTLGELKLQTLTETGREFAKKHKVTPPTAQVTLSDYSSKSNDHTVWFNSRFYRTNLIVEGKHLRIRDIHKFDERMASPYLTTPVTTNDFELSALPVLDGFGWSGDGTVAGIRPYFIDAKGRKVAMEGGQLKAWNVGADKLVVAWPLTNLPGAVLTFVFTEGQISVKLEKAPRSVKWYMEMTSKSDKKATVFEANPKSLNYSFNGYKYDCQFIKGSVSGSADGGMLKFTPSANTLVLKLN